MPTALNLPGRVCGSPVPGGVEEVQDIVLERCTMCPTKEPCRDGIAVSPKGARLESAQQIAARACDIFLQAGVTNAMPPANMTELEPEECDAIVAWCKAALEG
ncbi:hypothetical protein [Candidatus Halocynthiibacter alkanivorans]|uniref:hypothetical protein n=1 Tax=Candidatus Halocynthiibacter alkanivorans TaxID=2267619 RepID=UPI000DF18FF0|nr:hypothetical protein [Candidatus Halocynthiibacter alkanivorans]